MPATTRYTIHDGYLGGRNIVTGDADLAEQYATAGYRVTARTHA